MAIDPRYRVLLDEAGSEAKRLGSDVCLDVHVAIALVRRRREVAETLGASIDQLEDMARSERSESDSARELLEAASGRLASGRSPNEIVVELIKQRLELPDLSEAPVDAASISAAVLPPPTPSPAQSEPVPPADVPEHPATPPIARRDGGEGGRDSVALVGRAAVMEQLDALVRRRDGGAVVVHGRPGSGRTAVVRAFAEQLGEREPDRVVRYIPANEFLTDPQAAMALARSASPGQVFLIDDLDLVLALEQEYSSPATQAAMVALLSTGACVIAALPTSLRGRFEMTIGRLANQCAYVEVPPLNGASLDAVLERATADLAAHHDVTYDEGVRSAAAASPATGELRSQPALGLRRLDDAGATVAARGGDSVSVEDVVLGASSESSSASGAELAARLSTAVVGQDHAVERLTQRLLLTRARLDLRPERPDGVFLFVGPSGVGKTALARALSLELFGSESKLIRLDMSEYSEPWAISRLIGPQPGYVGSTEPESWLTTRIRNQPDSVLLLDEIEKAHPDVWNVFLQVFDAGRLTDSKGEVADFSSCVTILTSNLGTGITERKAIGFAQSGTDEDEHESRVLEVVKDTMRPELLNRLDSVVVFRSLDREAILAITRAETERVIASLGTRGFALRVDDDVIAHVADDGYDAAYGARHVQRSIERNLLEELAKRGTGRWHVSMVADVPVWQAI